MLIITYVYGTLHRKVKTQKNRPENLHTFLTKNDKLWRCGKTMEERVWARVDKLWESD